MILGLCVQGEKYIIDEGVEVVATPGHTSDDVSLIVQNTTNGTVLVGGKSSQFSLVLLMPYANVCNSVS